ncbi:MAG TPA: hypothetical protein VFP37_02760 [Steroidobacteraceae bacterium]|nr:hypothetical protein [Steroidobacteraceae bacterium]
MNGRFASILFAATSLLATACVAPYEVPAASAQVQVPPPGISIDLPLEARDADAPQFCQLGATCLELDPRPFTACLLATGRCPAEGEPLLVTEIAPAR